MKIGIFKPFTYTYFIDDKPDLSAVSIEVVAVANILADFSNDIYMISPCDLTPNHRINVGSLDEQYDRIILFSGSFALTDYKESIIYTLRNLTSRLDFYLTDLRLVPSEGLNEFDNIYTQATQPLEGIGGIYGGVSELHVYGQVHNSSIESSILRKDIRYYFGGTERDRLKDYIEYVYRPNCLRTTRCPFLNENNRVDRDEYRDILSRTKYSVVIADESYNNNHFITPRHYENITYDIVSFIDHKFDKDEHIVKLDDWRRVKNYIELHEKMNYLDENPDKYLEILTKQREEFKPEYLDGSYVYALIN